MTPLEILFSFMIGLAANGVTAVIQGKRRQKLKETLENEEGLRNALISIRSLRDEVRRACVDLARDRGQLEVSPEEEPLWRLLGDDCFQSDLTEWLMAGGIEEGEAVKGRLIQTMERALRGAGASGERIEFLKTGYFEELGRAVFSHPILAYWRHQLSLDYLREQVAFLRKKAEEAAGIYSPEKQKTAVDRYCEKALGAWDIIDLSNLPEGDVHIATQKLLLRQLYMPLRLSMEVGRGRSEDGAALSTLEERREARRLWEAGHRESDVPAERDRMGSSPVGECLKISDRLVVLGDPGGGKTTMLRWMATAYLLHYREDSGYSQFPDVQTLPDRRWIPVLIRCRDLGDADLCRSFTDFLTEHLRKTELLPEDADVMRAVVLDRIARGEVLLLVDGLDEIVNPQVRMMFCQELERIAARYPEAPIVVTSRIVGYRDMPYRMEAGFEHGGIAELTSEDKDLFAQRWVDITEQHQPLTERTKRVQELVDALHSSDRIERLTGNPMLLTTLALVKRKVGKLPNRRTKLYAEAVGVLLNWNPRHYAVIEEDEAIPQLEYLAYEMCRRGVQRLTEDEVLDLLEKVREEYPNIRAIRRRESDKFLKLLEARSSILIKSGELWREKRSGEQAVWEFRHLTFQEYLAARAMLDGRYPGRDRTKTLAGQVAPLASSVRQARGREFELEVVESWQEVLRLLVADCKDDDVDEVLRSIVTPLEGEDIEKTRRPRAVLAARCLADEPNVSEEVAREVLTAFGKAVGKRDGSGHIRTIVDAAAMEVGASPWRVALQECLADEFLRRDPMERSHPGSLLGMIQFRYDCDPSRFEEWFRSLVTPLHSCDPRSVATAALAVTIAAFEKKAITDHEIESALLALLDREAPLAYAGSWALFWLSGGPIELDLLQVWRLGKKDVEILTQTLLKAPPDDNILKSQLISLLAKSPKEDAGIAVEALIRQLQDGDTRVRIAAVRGLKHLGDVRAVDALIRQLEDPNSDLHRATVQALGRLGDKRAVEHLIHRLEDDDPTNRKEAIKALEQLSDARAVEPLIRRLKDDDIHVCVLAAETLIFLGDPRGLAARARFLHGNRADLRKAAIAYFARQCDKDEQRLLSRDLDAVDPWIDPEELISESRVADAAQRLEIGPEEVRSRYESLAGQLGLKLSWRDEQTQDG